VLKKGQLLYEGSPDGLNANQEGMLKLQAANMQSLEKALATYPGKSTLRKEGNYLMLNLNKGVKPEEVNQYLTNQGIYLSHLDLRKTTLEEQFLSLVK